MFSQVLFKYRNQLVHSSSVDRRYLEVSQVSRTRRLPELRLPVGIGRIEFGTNDMTPTVEKIPSEGTFSLTKRLSHFSDFHGTRLSARRWKII